jgi:hypothetical protein
MYLNQHALSRFFDYEYNIYNFLLRPLDFHVSCPGVVHFFPHVYPPRKVAQSTAI